LTEDERVRALRAQALLGDETLNEALAALEARVLDLWKNTSPAAVTAREELAAEMRAIQSIRVQLQTWVSDLAFAVRQQERRS
jgi:hypothetical protein